MDQVSEVCKRAEADGTLRDSRNKTCEDQPYMFFLRNGYNYLYNLDIYSENCQHQIIKDMRSIPHNFAYAMAPDQTVYLAGGGDFGTSDKSVLTNLFHLNFKEECASKKLASMKY